MHRIKWFGENFDISVDHNSKVKLTHLIPNGVNLTCEQLLTKLDLAPKLGKIGPYDYQT